jgi:hypothetical protein
LLRDFVAEPWVADLNLDRMERVNARFHGRRGARRDSDVIWRVPLTSGGDAYLLLMLEFQSLPDRWMALRVLVYAGLLWQQIVKERRLPSDGRLPPLFPVVLYNGESRWSMPTALDVLVGLPPESPLWQWQPGMRYHVIDEGAFGDADLAARETLAALLFRLENARQPDQVVAVVDAVIGWFRLHPEFDALKPLFAGLAGRVVEMAQSPGPAVKVSENLLEVRTMLAGRAAEWKRQWNEEGRQEGAAGVLLRLLERRFGPLPDTARARIASADVSSLENWGLRLLEAGSLDDVLR